MENFERQNKLVCVQTGYMTTSKDKNIGKILSKNDANRVLNKQHKSMFDVISSNMLLNDDFHKLNVSVLR